MSLFNSAEIADNNKRQRKFKLYSNDHNDDVGVPHIYSYIYFYLFLCNIQIIRTCLYLYCQHLKKIEKYK